MGVPRHLCGKICVRPSINARRKLHTLQEGLARNTDEFCKNTTLHGLKYVTNASLHPSERAFFMVSIVLVLVISSFYILKVYEKWATTPVIVGINPEPSFITNEPFPAVTVCNLNQALKSKAMGVTRPSIESEMLKLLCKHETTNRNTATNSSIEWNNLEMFIINISQPCESMVISCHFGAKDYDCSKYFFPIITDEGLCCAFNMIHPGYMYISHTPLSMRNISSGEFVPVDWYAERGYPHQLPDKFYPRTTTGTGESLGLSIALDVEADKYYCSSASSRGFKISLHSPNESPNVRETGVLIAPGAETKVRVRPEKTETTPKLRKMPTKYRRCLFHDERRLRYFAHYTQRNCEMECVAEKFLHHCGCIAFYMPKIYRNESICSLQAQQCTETVRLRRDPSIGSCLDACLPSCYDLTFFVDVFTIPLSQDGFQGASEKMFRFRQPYMNKNIALVNMYFKEYSFRSSIQTEFIGITDFLSSVGGLMGLFIGFSFISIVELIYYAIIHPFRKFLQRRRARADSVLATQKVRSVQSISGHTLSSLSTKRYLNKRLPSSLRRKKIYSKSMTKFWSNTPHINTDVLNHIRATFDKNQQSNFITNSKGHIVLE